MTPLVSIGLPVYNGQNFIRETIDSILAQTFPHFELIISDNASTDDTERLCRSYAAKDARIRYYRNPENLGAAYNHNLVFELARGAYFKWAAHDDTIAPDYIRRCLDALKNDPSFVLSYPATVVVDARGRHIRKHQNELKLTSPRPHQRYRQYHNIVHSNHGNHECHPIFGLIRADVLRLTPRIGSYVSPDLVLLAELALHGKFYEVPDYLYFKRQHSQTSIWAYRTIRSRIGWFDPKKKHKLHLSKWRWLYEYLGGIKRVRMVHTEKAACYMQMARWIVWNWKGLVRDLLKAVAWPFARPFLKF